MSNDILNDPAISADLATLEAELAEIRSKEVEIAAKRLELVKKVFHAESQSLFADNPALMGFRWSQYTPYFNDGDPCVFSSNHCDPEISFGAEEEAEEEAEDGDEWRDRWSVGKEEDKEALFEIVLSFLSKFTDEDMEEMFGDHAEIEVTRSGVEVSEYDHD